MEKAVSKREILLVKGELGVNKKSVVSSQALLSRELVDLRNKVRQFEFVSEFQIKLCSLD